MIMSKEDEILADQSTTEIALTAEEVAMFGKIAQMQQVHNVLGEALSGYRESIFSLRDGFVTRICRKYSIDKPNMVTFDPISKRLVSIFHQNLKGIKMEQEALVFRKLALFSITDTIRTLTTFLKTEGK